MLLCDQVITVVEKQLLQQAAVGCQEPDGLIFELNCIARNAKHAQVAAIDRYGDNSLIREAAVALVIVNHQHLKLAAVPRQILDGVVCERCIGKQNPKLLQPSTAGCDEPYQVIS